MSIEISAKQVVPIRKAYSHITRRLGEGKIASRYQEATYDVQPTTNFHYASAYAPQYDLYDPNRTAIVMEDWYAFMDPRQYYYSSYTMARAKQQATADKNYKFVERMELLTSLSDKNKKIIREVIIPLRHVEWAANLNGCNICDIGYGTAITQAAIFDSFDRLGIAQYLTRISLILEENHETGIDNAKLDWTTKDQWQQLRHLVEDTLVIQDWSELIIAQNVVLDGLLYPLIYSHLIPQITKDGGAPLAMLTEFMVEWDKERLRWTNKFVSVVAKESDANKAQLNSWVKKWTDRVAEALIPIADMAFDTGVKTHVNSVVADLQKNLSKHGL